MFGRGFNDTAASRRTDEGLVNTGESLGSDVIVRFLHFGGLEIEIIAARPQYDPQRLNIAIDAGSLGSF